MNNTTVINNMKAQNFDLIVKSVKGAKEDPTALLQLIDNLNTAVAFVENAMKAEAREKVEVKETRKEA